MENQDITGLRFLSFMVLTPPPMSLSFSCHGMALLFPFASSTMLKLISLVFMGSINHFCS